MFPILYYNNLDHSGLTTKFKKVVSAIANGDFKSAEVKKLKPSGYLRAKLDNTNRLLFLPVRYSDKTYMLILEVIKNHDYNKSRFLCGAEIKEENILPEQVNHSDNTTLQHIEDGKNVHLLDKFIVFDQAQSDIMQYPLPLIVIGSAGSGKTSVTLEKLKSLKGKCLYISLSSYLISHTQKVYYAHNYQNDDQEVEFLSFEEFLETIEIPKGKEINANAFMQWFSRQPSSKLVKDGRKLFEELRGVITGANSNIPYLGKEDYLQLGIKQSIYLQEQREEVYRFFEKYLNFLKKENYFDSNIVASQYLSKVEKKYDSIVIDEVQDFTNSQLALVLKSLSSEGQFLLSGDSNQIVHPNFFSWSKLKSYFYHGDELETHSITRILTKNYRNTPQVTELANRVLKLKNYRFGSIDKESHYLVESTSTTQGEVSCLHASNSMLKEFNDKTASSIKYAVLVLHEEDKRKVAQYLDTPLVFTVQEAKGLEYENIILYNFISSEPRYLEIAKGMNKDYLNADFDYSRAKNKTDKSLETYKFYVNSLYVAITRSIKNVYLLEDNAKHKFLHLLEINEIDKVSLKAESSSEEEWQKEASKLAQQGKEEQAKAIQDKVLKLKQVPWQPLDKENLEALRNKVLVEKTSNKKEQIKLLNYAILYADNKLIDELKVLGVRAANNVFKAIQMMDDNYFKDYAFRSDSAMLNKVKNYGLEFRNEFNLTPLMCAAYMGNSLHVESLLSHGANVYEVDNKYRTPLMIAMAKAVHEPIFARHKLANVYQQLKPDAISVQLDNKLVKIYPAQAEFLFLLYIMTVIRNAAIDDPSMRVVFTAKSLEQSFCELSSKVLPDFRKRRTYISSILSKNELNSNSPYNKKIFQRIKTGKYILADNLKIKIKDDWIDL